jgi:hypothetical protein
VPGTTIQRYKSIGAKEKLNIKRPDNHQCSRTGGQHMKGLFLERCCFFGSQHLARRPERDSFTSTLSGWLIANTTARGARTYPTRKLIQLNCELIFAIDAQLDRMAYQFELTEQLSRGRLGSGMACLTLFPESARRPRQGETTSTSRRLGGNLPW